MNPAEPVTSGAGSVGDGQAGQVGQLTQRGDLVRELTEGQLEDGRPGTGVTGDVDDLGHPALASSWAAIQA